MEYSNWTAPEREAFLHLTAYWNLCVTIWQRVKGLKKVHSKRYKGESQNFFWPNPCIKKCVASNIWVGQWLTDIYSQRVAMRYLYQQIWNCIFDDIHIQFDGKQTLKLILKNRKPHISCKRFNDNKVFNTNERDLCLSLFISARSCTTVSLVMANYRPSCHGFVRQMQQCLRVV